MTDTRRRRHRKLRRRNRGKSCLEKKKRKKEEKIYTKEEERKRKKEGLVGGLWNFLIWSQPVIIADLPIILSSVVGGLSERATKCTEGNKMLNPTEH